MAEADFKIRSDVHLARKIWHLLTVLAMVSAYHNMNRYQALTALAIACLIFMPVDILRLRWDGLNNWILFAFKPIIRKHELTSLAGTTFLLAGVTTIAIFFPKPVVKLTLIFLAVGDPIASYAGLRYGRDVLVGKKTLQGTLAAFFACAIIAGFYFYLSGLMQERLILVSLLAGLIGAVSELVPVGRLDDNLTFPIMCACMLYGLFYLFGGPGVLG